MTDAAYVARLARHYEIFKEDLRNRPVADAEVLSKSQPRVAIRTGAGRNDLCPCGSGKKYKICCGARKAKVELPSLGEYERQRAAFAR